MSTATRMFQATNGFRVADETHVFPFLNSNDVKSGLPAGLLDDFSLAIGEIEPRSASKIHVHPIVTQVTLVLDGRLEIRIREPSAGDPQTLRLVQHQAALILPGTFLQLINRSVFPCRVVYVVGPAYVFDADDDGKPLYADAVTLDESWERLAKVDWRPQRLIEANVTPERRAAALQRIRSRATT